VTIGPILAEPPSQKPFSVGVRWMTSSAAYTDNGLRNVRAMTTFD